MARSHLLALVLSSVLAGCGDSGSSDPSTIGNPWQCEAEAPLVAVAARQTVTFDLVYAGSAPAWGVSAGQYCSAVEITSASGGRLALTTPYQTVCEGPPPPSPSVGGAVRLGPQGTRLSWDGRALRSYRTCFDCSPAWHGMGLVPEHHYVPQPVEPGFYRARIGILDSKPDHCGTDEEGGLYCWGYGYGNGWPSASDPSEGCQASRYVEVQFELPASGNVVVPVIVPPRHQLAARPPTALDRPALRPLGDL